MMRDFTPRTLPANPANHPSLFLGLSLLLCLTVLSVEAGYGQDQQAPSKRRFLRWSYQDAADWVETTDRKRLLRTAGFVAVLVPISFLDEEVSEAAMDWDSGLFGDFLDGSNEAGSLTAPLIPTGIFLVSLATDTPKFQDAAFTSLQAIIYTHVTSLDVPNTPCHGTGEPIPLRTRRHRWLGASGRSTRPHTGWWRAPATFHRPVGKRSRDPGHSGNHGRP